MWHLSADSGGTTMNRYLSIIVLSTIWFPLQAQWQNMSGQFIGDITSIAVYGSELFANGGSNYGLCRSQDKGAHWSVFDSRWEAEASGSLFVSGSRLFAGYFGGVLAYRINGSELIPDTIKGVTGSFKGSALNGPDIFVSTEEGIFCSTDTGSTWAKIYSGYCFGLGFSGTYLISPTDFNGGLRRTSDHGAHWETISTDIENFAVGFYDIAGKIYALTGSDKVYSSTNDGATWSLDTKIPITRGTRVVGVQKFEGMGYFLSSDSGVFLSTDRGASWIPKNTGLTKRSVGALVQILNQQGGTTLFASTSDGYFTSTNFGTNWSQVNAGIARYPVRVLATVGTTLLAGSSGGGAYCSTDDGMYWTPSDPAVLKGSVTGFARSGTNIFAGTKESGVFSSTDSGSSWNAVNSGLTSCNITSLCTNNSYLFAGSYNSGAFRSSNNGKSWEIASAGLTDIYISSLAVNGTHIFMGELFDGVYHSTDNGTSWSKATVGLSDTRIQCLEMSGTTLYAGTMTGHVYRTFDFGEHWEEYGSDLPNTSVTSLFAYRSNLFVGTDVGVFLLADNGARYTWTDSGQIHLVSSFALSGTYIIAGGANGVWRRPLSEMTAVGEPSDVPPLNYGLQQNFPNPFNPTTSICFQLPSAGRVRLQVFDLLGREVQRLVDDTRGAGAYSVRWDAHNVSSGVYFYRLTAKDFVSTKKLVLIK